jgi:transcriptional regulator with XRE-family HTH domain
MTFSVGEALRGFRLRQGLTLSEVARRSGNEFKVSSLGAYERGDRSITFERLQLLATVYGVDVQSLLGMRTPTTRPGRFRSRGVGIADRPGVNASPVLPDARAAEVMGFGQANTQEHAPRSSLPPGRTPGGKASKQMPASV